MLCGGGVCVCVWSLGCGSQLFIVCSGWVWSQEEDFAVLYLNIQQEILSL